MFVLSNSCGATASDCVRAVFHIRAPTAVGKEIGRRYCIFSFTPSEALGIVTRATGVSTGTKGADNGSHGVVNRFLGFYPVVSVRNSGVDRFSMPGVLRRLGHICIREIIHGNFRSEDLCGSRLVGLGSLRLRRFSSLGGVVNRAGTVPGAGRISVGGRKLASRRCRRLRSLRGGSGGENESGRPLARRRGRHLTRLGGGGRGHRTTVSVLQNVSVHVPLLVCNTRLRSRSRRVAVSGFTSLVSSRS